MDGRPVGQKRQGTIPHMFPKNTAKVKHPFHTRSFLDYQKIFPKPNNLVVVRRQQSPFKLSLSATSKPRKSLEISEGIPTCNIYE
jgi:hypothetical protein